jgi:hypothetical protein
MIDATVSVPACRNDRRLSTVLQQVLGREHGQTVRELVSFEKGATASDCQVLYWMRVNMPTAAGRVDDALACNARWN